jgi:GR25 family glycosyltransferase involved in LPS biosynthesis
VTTPYLIHIEDDRELMMRKSYIGDMIEIFEDDDNIGQVCFNHNYAETVDDDIKGGLLVKTKSDCPLFYYIHEYCPTEELKAIFQNKYGYVKNCNYYPHFSLSPSMIRTEIFKKVMFQDEHYFEFRFGLRYVEAGFKTAFLPGFHFSHIGRLTSQMYDLDKYNAYDLLNTQQFAPKLKYKSWVINLDKRQDRMDIINSQRKALPSFTRFSAYDGKTLTVSPRMRSLCRYNDFKMRTGVIGCALSHMKLYKQLIDEQHVDGYVIIEDDIVVPDDFVSKMNRVFSIIENRYIHPDVVFFTIIPKNDINQQPKGLIRQTYEEIKNISIGGTGCYYVSKKGARNILDRIDKLTLECAIDAVLYRMSDDYDIYYTFPPIASQVNDPISNVQDDFNYTSPLYEDNIQDSYFSTHVVYNDKGEIDLFDDLKV